MAVQDYAFIDAHTHILPGMDDGPADVSVSEQIIVRLMEQGVNEVFLTPHYYPHRESIDSFLRRRAKCHAVLEPVLNHYGMKYRLGAEVYAIPVIFNFPNISDLCIEGTNMLLFEMSTVKGDPAAEFRMIDELYARCSVRILLAHINRYPFMLKKKYMEAFLDLNCLMQLNLEFMKADLFKRQRYISYIKQGYVQFLGTDCHHIEGRKTPEVETYIRKMQKYLTPEEFAVIQ